MARFVLVHGAWHGAWAWREVAPKLEAGGHQALVIDLPGHGADRRPPESVTLQDYANRVVEAVEASPVEGPKDKPILVGHSMGGVVSQAAELTPHRLRALVYIAAFIPPSGSCMMPSADGFDPDFLAHFLWAPDRRTARISPEGARRFLYPVCPPATVECIVPLLTPEPVAPHQTPLHLTEANFGRVPKYYIECLQDKVVPIRSQRDVRQSLRVDGVYSLDTDHSPFLSAPEDLAAILHEIAGKV